MDVAICARFVQQHYNDVPLRNSKSVNKRRRNIEYVKCPRAEPQERLTFA